MRTSQAEEDGPDRSRIILGLLQSVERNEAVSQRRLAAELGIALGLVNAYLKRCITKGWIKVSEVPARRYLYYLTPHGFAEKSRLTVEYLSYSFSFFREARGDCAEAFQAACAAGCKRMVLAGASDLAEIATICALESRIEIVGVVDAAATGDRFLGLPILASFSAAAEDCDGVLLTDLVTSADTLSRAVEHFGRDRVFVPSLLTGRALREAAKTNERVQ
jgi:DNA-binding MarR family transcriptional regulator